jgi:hypothetical protein
MSKMCYNVFTFNFCLWEMKINTFIKYNSNTDIFDKYLTLLRTQG